MKIVIIVLIVLISLYLFWQIGFAKINRVEFKSYKIKNDISILQISDFHSNKFLKIEEMLNQLSKEDIDLILITGDIIDKNDRDLSYSLDFLKRLLSLEKEIYYVLGNHELNNKNREYFISELKSMGISLLDNESRVIGIKNNNINIVGYTFASTRKTYKDLLDRLDNSYFNLVLSHSASSGVSYYNGNEDLILSGHSHGGQIRLPVLFNSFSKESRLFARVAKGSYKLGESTNLYVDSGLGYRLIPIRIFNRIQVSLIKIKN